MSEDGARNGSSGAGRLAGAVAGGGLGLAVGLAVGLAEGTAAAALESGFAAVRWGAALDGLAGLGAGGLLGLALGGLGPISPRVGVGLGLLATLATAGWSARPAPAPTIPVRAEVPGRARPDLVWIAVDGLPADPGLPTLDAWAAEGLRMSDLHTTDLDARGALAAQWTGRLDPGRGATPVRDPAPGVPTALEHVAFGGYTPVVVLPVTHDAAAWRGPNRLVVPVLPDHPWGVTPATTTLALWPLVRGLLGAPGPVRPEDVVARAESLAAERPDTPVAWFVVLDAQGQSLGQALARLDALRDDGGVLVAAGTRGPAGTRPLDAGTESTTAVVVSDDADLRARVEDRPRLTVDLLPFVVELLDLAVPPWFDGDRMLAGLRDDAARARDAAREQARVEAEAAAAALEAAAPEAAAAPEGAPSDAPGGEPTDAPIPPDVAAAEAPPQTFAADGAPLRGERVQDPCDTVYLGRDRGVIPLREVIATSDGPGVHRGWRDRGFHLHVLPDGTRRLFDRVVDATESEPLADATAVCGGDAATKARAMHEAVEAALEASAARAAEHADATLDGVRLPPTPEDAEWAPFGPGWEALVGDRGRR